MSSEKKGESSEKKGESSEKIVVTSEKIAGFSEGIIAALGILIGVFFGTNQLDVSGQLVAICTTFSFPATVAACVPLPAPGAPRKIIYNICSYLIKPS